MVGLMMIGRPEPICYERVPSNPEHCTLAIHTAIDHQPTLINLVTMLSARSLARSVVRAGARGMCTVPRLRAPSFVAFAGSARDGSANGKLAEAAARSMRAHGATVDFIDVSGLDMPLYNQAREPVG